MLFVNKKSSFRVFSILLRTSYRIYSAVITFFIYLLLSLISYKIPVQGGKNKPPIFSGYLMGFEQLYFSIRILALMCGTTFYTDFHSFNQNNYLNYLF